MVRHLLPAAARLFTTPPLLAQGLAGMLLTAGLAGCSHLPETVSIVSNAAPALSTAPADSLPPTLDASDTKATPATALPKPKPVKLVRPARPVAAAVTAAPVAVVLPAAAPTPAPEPVPAAPATRTQAGRVLDENGRPLIGATVMLRGSTKGTSTDANGNYSLEVPAGENTFVVGYGGYQDETAVNRDAQPLNVTLLPTPGTRVKGRRGQ